MSRFLLMLCLIFPGFAGDDPISWGDIPAEDLAMTSFDDDPDAEALVLADYGKVWLTDQFDLIFERHVRIKILNSDGFEWAKVVIPFRETRHVTEKVTNIEGAVYNLVNGKETRTKLAKKHIFRENLNRNFESKSFTLPALKPGSVIEYRYKVKTAVYYFPDWDFQWDIPVRWSELRTHLPKMLVYQYGLVTLPYDIEESDSDRMTFTYKATGSSSSSISSTAWRPQTRAGVSSVDSSRVRRVIKNIPALRSEPLCGNLEDYRAVFRAQLARLAPENDAPTIVLGSWEDLARKLMVSGGLGNQLKPSKAMGAKAAAATRGMDDPMDKMRAIYRDLVNTTSWDGVGGYLADRDVEEVIAKGVGSVPDLALTLVNLLRSADLQAYPVLLTTRDRSRVQGTYPIPDQFNYLVVLAVINEKGYLMDPTRPNLRPGLIDFKAMHGQGWLIDEDIRTWISLEQHRESAFVNVLANLDGDGVLNGTVSISSDGYQAVALREDRDAEAHAKTWFKTALSDLEVTEVTLDHLDDPDEKLLCKLNFNLRGQPDGDSLFLEPYLGRYLDPVLREALETQPFKANDRKLPIDLGYPRSWTYVANITLPEGYAVETPPKPRAFQLLDGQLAFRGLAMVKGNRLTLNTTLRIGRARFQPGEYEALRAFFTEVISALNESITLTKVEEG